MVNQHSHQREDVLEGIVGPYAADINMELILPLLDCRRY